MTPSRFDCGGASAAVAGVEVRRHAGILARHVVADPGPVLAAVRGLEQILIAEVERVLIAGETPAAASRCDAPASADRPRRNPLDLTGVDVRTSPPCRRDSTSGGSAVSGAV
jgi:hypothetical protein